MLHVPNPVDPSIIANLDGYTYYHNAQSRIVQIYNDHFLSCHLKGAFAGISSLSASGIAITAAAVALHIAGVGGAILVLGALATSGLGIVAITASILWWVVIANQSDAFKTEKENELYILHANVKRNIATDPNFYKKHIEVT